MAEVAAVPWNGRAVISLFAGCGGSCLGYRMAGFRVLWASEFIPAAAECYRLNHPGAILDTRDIREVQPEEILAAVGLKRGELDLLDGSPPCASFSTAGKREAGWGKVKQYSDTKQRVDDLFFEYARIVEGVQPKVFVAENVSGLVKGTAKGYFKLILARLKACGYRVQARLLDAQWLGVPQMRQRLFFVGVREDMGREPAFPKPLPYRYSVREAIPWITEISGRTGPSFRRVESELDQPMNSIVVSDPEQTRYEVRAVRDDRGAYGNGGDITDLPSPTVLSDSVGTHWVETRIGRFNGSESIDQPAPSVRKNGRRHTQSELTVETRQVEPEASMSGYAIGREWDTLAPGESNFYGGGRLWRPDPDQPSPTVTQKGGDASAASVTHPVERRKFSIAELKRICAFPDDFQFSGTYAQRWERLGRAVPPLMMRALAEVIRDQILCAE